jgi:4-amino-4-deoxy-L-arabinose transferase-like glycosyltransferase
MTSSSEPFTPAWPLPRISIDTRRRTYERCAALGVLGAVAAVVLLPNLGGYALWDPDEARHAEVAREMFAGGTWQGFVVPMLNGVPYHDKPILFYWCVSLAYALGGISAQAARIVSVLAAAATTIATFAWGVRQWGVRAGIWSAVVLVTGFEFAALGRYASLDMLLTAWITIGVLAMERWATDPVPRPWWIAAGLAGALGFLTKGLVAPLLVFGIGGVRFLSRDAVRVPTGRQVVATMALVSLLVGPWLAAAGWLDPSYLSEFFIRHHFERYAGHAGMGAHPKPVWFYLPIVVGGLFPWIGLLPAAIRRDRDGAARFCLGWATAVVLLFSCGRGKLGTYILPCFVPLALVIGRFVANGLREAAADVRWVVRGGLGIAAGFGIAGPLLLVLHQMGLVPTPRATLAPALVGFPIAAVITWVALRRVRLLPAAIAAGALITLCLFYGQVAPQLSQVVSEAPMAALIRANTPAGAEPTVVGYSVRPLSLLFYLARPVPVTDDPERVAAMVRPGGLVFVVTNRKAAPRLLAAVPLEPWLVDGRHQLYASQPRPSMAPRTANAAP